MLLFRHVTAHVSDQLLIKYPLTPAFLLLSCLFPPAATEAEASLPLSSVSEFGPLLSETPVKGAPWFGFHVSTCDGLRFELATSSRVKVRRFTTFKKKICERVNEEYCALIGTGKMLCCSTSALATGCGSSSPLAAG